MATGSNMAEKNNWFFPIADYGTKQGLNDSGLETFLDNPLESLVRETIQNSLDAKQSGTGGPVRVHFDFFGRPIIDMPGIESLKADYIPNALQSWNSDSNEYIYLKSINDSLVNDGSIKILRIADYNTTGLNKSNWDALVKETGVSSKRDNQAAGSKGIGKNAPFAASKYRTVIYNTKTSTYEQSIGVINTVSYEEQGGNGVSQSKGFLGSANNEPFGYQSTFMNDRVEIGTDVFVVGVKDEYAESQNIIILNVLEHFLLSIYNDALEVQVDSEVINSSTIQSHLDHIKNIGEIDESRFLNVMKNYNVLKNEKTKIIHMDEDFVEKYQFISNIKDATFMLLAEPDGNQATNRVLMARKSGMVIKSQQFRAGVNFSGIFQATGPSLNKFLRTLESAEHDDWVAERAEYKNRSVATKFLKDLNEFFRKHIKELIEDNPEEVIDAYGMADLLPDEKIGENNEETESLNTIEPVLANVNIRDQKKYKQQLKLSDDNPDIDGGGEGDEPGSGGRKKPKHPPVGLPVPNPNPPTGSPTPRLKEVLDSKIRVLESDVRSGKYFIRLEPKHTLMDAKLIIAASGESGDYQLNIESVEGAGARVDGRDSLVISMVEAGKTSEVSLKINYGFRVRMKVLLYEIQ